MCRSTIVARPQRQGVGGNAAGGERVALRGRRLAIPAPANDNRLGARGLTLRLLPAMMAIALATILIRYAVG